MKQRTRVFNRCIATMIGIAGMLNFFTVSAAEPQLPDFTYQGQLRENGQPANGNYDLTFTVYDALTGGNKIGPSMEEIGFPVSGGLFTVSLSYPNEFTGTQLWLEVKVDNVAMAPRAEISTVPVAQFALTGSIAPSGPASGALTGSYPSPSLATNSVGAPNIQSGSVDHTKILGSHVAENVSLTVAANTCATIPFNLTGAAVGDIPIITFGAGATPPSGLVLGPASVVSAGLIKAVACNMGSSQVAVSNFGLIVQTIR